MVSPVEGHENPPTLGGDTGPAGVAVRSVVGLWWTRQTRARSAMSTYIRDHRRQHAPPRRHRARLRRRAPLGHHLPPLSHRQDRGTVHDRCTPIANVYVGVVGLALQEKRKGLRRRADSIAPCSTAAWTASFSGTGARRSCGHPVRVACGLERALARWVIPRAGETRWLEHCVKLD